MTDAEQTSARTMPGAAIPRFDQAGLALVRRPIWVFDPATERMLHANDAALALWASPSLEAFLARDFGGTSEVVRERTRAMLRRLADGETVRERTTIYPGGPTASCDLLISGLAHADERGERVVMLIEAAPIEASADEKRAFEALRHLGSPVTLYDAGGRAIFRSPAAERAYGGKPCFADSFARVRDAAPFWEAAWRAAERHGGVHRMTTTAGARWHDLVARVTRDPATGADCLLLEERDISAEVEARERAEHMADHDALTGLANRARFKAALTEAARAWSERGEAYAVVYIDLDRFKEVNDTFGHAAGDALLMAVAGRLRACVPASDLLARLGGDEFALLIRGSSAADAARTIAARCVKRLGERFSVGGNDLRIGGSAGIGHAADADTANGVLRIADQALYRAKADGRGRVGGTVASAG